MAQKTLHGARCKVAVVDPLTGQARVVGIWNSFSFSVTYDVQPSFILGRYSAGELSTTAMEPVSISAQGWRVVDHDIFTEGKFTNLKDLLFQEYLVLTVIDRQTKKAVATIHGCLPTGFSTAFSAKQLTEQPCSFVGLLMDSETTVNAEASDASVLPQ